MNPSYDFTVEEMALLEEQLNEDFNIMTHEAGEALQAAKVNHVQGRSVDFDEVLRRFTCTHKKLLELDEKEHSLFEYIGRLENRIGEMHKALILIRDQISQAMLRSFIDNRILANEIEAVQEQLDLERRLLTLTPDALLEKYGELIGEI